MNREKKLEIARYVYKEIKQVIDTLERDGTVRAGWDEYIIVDGEGFGYQELDEKHYLKKQNDKSFDASKIYCESTEKFEKHDIDSQIYKERIRKGNHTT